MYPDLNQTYHTAIIFTFKWMYIFFYILLELFYAFYALFSDVRS